MAEYKDYTNIAGTPFQPYVTQQIEKRKELIKKENRSPSDLQWLTNKNVWIRISSGADVEENNADFDDLGEVKGQKLARKYILQGGLFKDTSVINDNGSTQDIKTLREGIGPDSAYGIGGNDFGYRPMPGLTNLSIKTGGKLGTLREATFDFTCYNKKQLDIMSALYMRLGFGVLIEWGHIPFINNEGRLETNPLPLSFFQNSNQAGINDKEELLEKIQSQRVAHSGNYDALWGTIKNFSYSLEDNGTFKCQVQLVGAGDILESLKINQSGNKSSDKTNQTEEDKAIYATISSREKSDLNKALYEYYKKVTEINTSSYNFNASVSFLELVEKYLKPKLNISFYLNGNNFNWKKNDELQRKGYHYSLISKLNQNNGNTQLTEIPDIPNPQNFFSRLIVGYSINGNDKISNNTTEPGLEQAYITLGHLLLLIKATGWLYDKNQDQIKPYIYIDVNPETNRCYTFPGHCSLDPTVCLIGSQELPFKIKNSQLFTLLQDKYPFYDSINPELGGRFMQTLVNIEFVTSTLKKYTKNKENNIYFVDFMKDILNSISKACGGFNEFRIVPDDNSNCIRIFDDRTMPGKDVEPNKYIKIPVLGKNSIVYNFNYTSKISPQMATQIVISAQAQDGGINTNKDALAFSHLNGGLKNRLVSSRVESPEEENEDPQTSSLSTYIELRSHLQGIYDGVGISLVTQEDFDIVRKESGITPEGIQDIEELSNNDQFLRNYLTQLCEKIVLDLQEAAENLTPESKDGRDENKRLSDARDEVLKIISGLNSIPGIISNGVIIKINDPKKPTFSSTLKSQNLYIHNLLKNKYEAVNGERSSDTEIEAAWTKIAQEQTGTNGSFY